MLKLKIVFNNGLTLSYPDLIHAVGLQFSQSWSKINTKINNSK